MDRELTLNDFTLKKVQAAYKKLNEKPCQGGKNCALDAVVKANNYYKDWVYAIDAQRSLEYLMVGFDGECSKLTKDHSSNSVLWFEHGRFLAKQLGLPVKE